MAYNYLKLHEIASYEISRHTYIGLGYHLDYFYRIRDDALQLDSMPFELTPHFIYSELYDFDPERYLLSGISINFVYDSRDNLINPYRGYFVNANLRFNPTFLGSSRNSTSLWLEFRTYQSLSKKTPRHLLAFWLFGSFRLSGRQPYLTLMALGEDQRARSGRGYIPGRFRGDNLVYGEVEYRFPITPCSGVLGGVAFVNAITASNQTRDLALFEHIRVGPGSGCGSCSIRPSAPISISTLGWGTTPRGFIFQEPKPSERIQENRRFLQDICPPDSVSSETFTPDSP